MLSKIRNSECLYKCERGDLIVLNEEYHGSHLDVMMANVIFKKRSSVEYDIFKNRYDAPHDALEAFLDEFELEREDVTLTENLEHPFLYKYLTVTTDVAIMLKLKYGV